jgi:hypothetical protein
MKKAAAILMLVASPAVAQLQTLPAPKGSSVAVATAAIKATAQPCKKIVSAHRVRDGMVHAVCAQGGAKREGYVIFKARGIDKIFALRCAAAKRLVNVTCDEGAKGVDTSVRSAQSASPKRAQVTALPNEPGGGKRSQSAAGPRAMNNGAVSLPAKARIRRNAESTKRRAAAPSNLADRLSPILHDQRLMLRELSDAELLRLWQGHECSDENSCAEEDAVAAELERRNLDF